MSQSLTQQYDGKVIERLNPGASTASDRNIDYRIGKLMRHNIVREHLWLDCGCADGGYVTGLLRYGARYVTGIDIEADRIVAAKQTYLAEQNCDFCVSLAERMPFPEDTFDGVLLNEVLEHVIDELGTLREIFRVLQPEGCVAVISPSRWFPFEGHGMKLYNNLHIKDPVPLLPWIPMFISKHFLFARNYWPHELEELIRKAGFDIAFNGPVLAVFDFYPWIPKPLLRWYQAHMLTVEQIPIINRLVGVSTLVIGYKPGPKL